MTSHPSTTISHPIPISIPESKPKANLRLLPCDPLVDGPALLAQQIAAFSNPREPFFFVLFPETEEREKAVRRLVDIWVSDEKAKYVKIIDEKGMSNRSYSPTQASCVLMRISRCRIERHAAVRRNLLMVSEGTLISAAKWLVNTEPLREEQKKERITVDWHPDNDSNDWAEHLINWIHQHQIRRTEGKPCVSTYHFLPVLVPPSPFHPHLLHTLTRNFPHSPRHPINTPFTPKTRCWLPLDAVRYSNRRFPQFTSVY